MVIRSSDSAEVDRVELFLARGSSEEQLLSLVEGLRGIAGIREISTSVDEVGSLR
jgi:hypothetical protein